MWVEIAVNVYSCDKAEVTPFAGVWVEIAVNVYSCDKAEVTPFAGVWVEIIGFYFVIPGTKSHTLRGCVG